MLKRVLGTGVLLVLVAAGPASAAGADRQTASLRFTTTAPGAPTGIRFSVDWHDPANPSGKPYSVKRVIVHSHPGTRVDTGVPPQCKATDAQLYAQGAAACPVATQVGGGTITSDTGGAFGPFPRFIDNKVWNFNNDGEIIGLADSTNAPLIPGVTRVVTHSRIVGNSTTFDVPGPFPGTPPPDPYAALKTLRTGGDPIVIGGRAYALTPPDCPASGHWTNTLTFIYRDGVSQTVSSESPCHTEVAHAPTITGTGGTPGRPGAGGGGGGGGGGIGSGGGG